MLDIIREMKTGLKVAWPALLVVTLLPVLASFAGQYLQMQVFPELMNDPPTPPRDIKGFLLLGLGLWLVSMFILLGSWSWFLSQWLAHEFNRPTGMSRLRHIWSVARHQCLSAINCTFLMVIVFLPTAALLMTVFAPLLGNLHTSGSPQIAPIAALFGLFFLVASIAHLLPTYVFMRYIPALVVTTAEGNRLRLYETFAYGRQHAPKKTFWRASWQLLLLILVLTILVAAFDLGLKWAVGLSIYSTAPIGIVALPLFPLLIGATIIRVLKQIPDGQPLKSPAA